MDCSVESVVTVVAMHRRSRSIVETSMGEPTTSDDGVEQRRERGIAHNHSTSVSSDQAHDPVRNEPATAYAFRTTCLMAIVEMIRKLRRFDCG